jgi:L-threonylcarbamoyladenylate synthase
VAARRSGSGPAREAAPEGTPGAPAAPARLAVDPVRPAAPALAAAARLLRAGALVGFPTETFYGLGANALDAGAVARVFAAKGRPAGKPLLVLIDSLAMLDAIAREVPDRARGLMARHWPGPLTLVLPARPELPAALTAGTGTIGIRLPGHAVARGLVAAAGVPVTAPSANPHGAPSPVTADEVVAGLGARVALVLDAGPTPGGPPSTVLDMTRVPAVVLRAGAVALAGDELASS